MENSREKILGRLKAAPVIPSTPRPPFPGKPCEALAGEQMVEKFRTLLEAQTGVFHRVRGDAGVLGKLGEVLSELGVSKALAATDSVLAGLNLPQWAHEQGFEITTHKDYADRESYKKAAFEEVQAGITGVDHAFAESGTLCIAAGPDSPRLPSLAPIVHIAVVPADCLKPNYELMVKEVFHGQDVPSQVFFITGPSMTADIGCHPFKGMHGPQRLIVIFREEE